MHSATKERNRKLEGCSEENIQDEMRGSKDEKNWKRYKWNFVRTNWYKIGAQVQTKNKVWYVKKQWWIFQIYERLRPWSQEAPQT